MYGWTGVALQAILDAIEADRKKQEPTPAEIAPAPAEESPDREPE